MREGSQYDNRGCPSCGYVRIRSGILWARSSERSQQSTANGNFINGTAKTHRVCSWQESVAFTCWAVVVDLDLPNLRNHQFPSLRLPHERRPPFEYKSLLIVPGQEVLQRQYHSQHWSPNAETRQINSPGVGGDSPIGTERSSCLTYQEVRVLSDLLAPDIRANWRVGRTHLRR